MNIEKVGREIVVFESLVELLCDMLRLLATVLMLERILWNILMYGRGNS